MNDAPFQPGDLVRLKSGGPLMTVVDCQPLLDKVNFFVRAIWHDKDDHIQTHDFTDNLLIRQVTQ